MIAIAVFFLASVIAISANNIADAIRGLNLTKDDEDEDEND